MNKIFTWLKEHPLALFFPLAYSISWSIWLPRLAFVQELSNEPATPYLHLLGSLGPMLAAILVTGLIYGRTALRDFVQKMFHWRVDVRWHLIAWLGPITVFAIAAVIDRIMSGVWPDFSRFGQSQEYPLLPLMVYWIASILFSGWGEETGWRGFALPLLQKGNKPFIATFILSSFWALWHLPVFFFVDGFMKMGLGGAVGWYFSILLSAVLFSWLYNGSNGSILIVAAFHGVANIIFDSPVSGNIANLTGMIMTIWGIIVLLVYKPTALSRSESRVIGSIKAA